MTPSAASTAFGLASPTPARCSSTTRRPGQGRQHHRHGAERQLEGRHPPRDRQVPRPLLQPPPDRTPRRAALTGARSHSAPAERRPRTGRRTGRRTVRGQKLDCPGPTTRLEKRLGKIGARGRPPARVGCTAPGQPVTAEPDLNNPEAPATAVCVVPAPHVRESASRVTVPIPGRHCEEEPRIELIREGEVVRAIEIACPCGRRVRVLCEYPGPPHQPNGRAAAPAESAGVR